MANSNPPEHTRFKKGISGNPGGRPKLPESLKNTKEFTTEEINRVIARYMRMPQSELVDLLRTGSKAMSMFELMITSIITKSWETGDFSKLEFLLNRSVGKVKDVSEVHTHAVDPEKEKLIDKMDREKVFELLKSNG